MSYDVIVVGLGGMGSAAAYHLAARGQRVLGLERHTPAHDQGSSHGGSRLVRQSYFEDPAYVPLLLRAYELWEQLGRDSGQDVLTLTGGLFLGREDSLTFAGSLRASQQWGLPHEVLSPAEVRRRFPTFTPAKDELALYEAKAGFARPRRPSRRTSCSPSGRAPICASRSRCCPGSPPPAGCASPPAPGPTTRASSSSRRAPGHRSCWPT